MKIKFSSLLSLASVAALTTTLGCSKLNEDVNSREGQSTTNDSSENSLAASDGGFQLTQPDLGDVKDALKVHLVVQEFIYCAEKPVPLQKAQENSVALTADEEDSLIACDNNQGRVVSDVTMPYEAKKLMRLKIAKGDYLVTLEILGAENKVLYSGKAKASVDANGNGKAHIELSKAKGEGSLVISASIVRELPFCKLVRIARPAACVPGRSAMCSMTLRGDIIGTEPTPGGQGEVIQGTVECSIHKARLAVYKVLCEREVPRDQITFLECQQSVAGQPGNPSSSGGNGSPGAGAPGSMP